MQTLTERQFPALMSFEPTPKPIQCFGQPTFTEFPRGMLLGHSLQNIGEAVVRATRPGRSLAVMAPTCAQTDCPEPVVAAAGRCDQHAVELAAVLAMLDEMRHVPGQTPD